MDYGRNGELWTTVLTWKIGVNTGTPPSGIAECWDTCLNNIFVQMIKSFVGISY